MAIFESKSKDIEMQPSVAWRKQMKENRQRLIPVIESAHHCGRQGVALHGDNESGVLSLEESLMN